MQERRKGHVSFGVCGGLRRSGASGTHQEGRLKTEDATPVLPRTGKARGFHRMFP